MKIGIFGGSFNPLHNAHIHIANYILEQMKLDKMIIIPVGIPSHKNTKMADGSLRLQMCQEAFKDNEKMVISDIEINLAATSYTIDTLEKLRALYGEENEYFEIVGEDSINNITTWKDYERILELSKIVVFKRFDYKKVFEHENVIYLDTPVYPISSTLIREKIKNNEDVRSYIPDCVLKIIEKNNLYLV